MEGWQYFEGDDHLATIEWTGPSTLIIHYRSLDFNVTIMPDELQCNCKSFESMAALMEYCYDAFEEWWESLGKGGCDCEDPLYCRCD